MTKSIIARSSAPTEWFRPRLPGELASDVRSARPPLNPASGAAMPPRVDIAKVREGDRIGSRVVIAISVSQQRVHGYPCHCCWGTHAACHGDCSHDNPLCPCHEVVTRYRFTCRCDCGRIQDLCEGVVSSGSSLSCGHCHHRSPYEHSQDPSCGRAG
jgi:hypothetical protein